MTDTLDRHVPVATRTAELRDLAADALRRCGADPDALPGTGRVDVVSPVTGEAVATVPFADAADVERAIDRAHAAFLPWRTVPAPVRGRLVKRFGELLTEHQDALADLVGVEVGKIVSEARGEVQEMIDICDFAVGLSRQLEGRTMPSERPGHRLMETWHPLGVVGVISAFNFPCAVWAWNAAIALVCGDTVVWKPSERTPLVAVAAAALLDRAAREVGAPDGLNTVVVTDAAGAAPLLDSPRVPLVSATGSERMGARSRRGWPPASAGRSSSWAATTPPSSRRRPTSTSPCAASCSPPPAPPASGARRCGG